MIELNTKAMFESTTNEIEEALGELESAGLERAQRAVEQTTRVVKASLTYAAELQSTARKQAFEGVRTIASLMTKD